MRLIRHFFSLPILATTGAPVTEQSGHIDSSQVRRLVVIPDTHGDRLATAHALFLAFKEIEPNHPEAQDYVSFAKLLVSAISDSDYPAIPLSAATDVGLIQLGDLVDKGPYGETCISMILAVPRLLGWPTWMLYGNHEQLSMGSASRTNPYCARKEEVLFGSFANRDAAYGMSFADPGKAEPLCLDEEGDRANHPKQCSLYDELNDNSLAILRWGPPVVAGSEWSSAMLGAATLFVHGGVNLAWLDRLLAARSDEEDLIDAVNAEVKARMRNLHVRENMQSMSEPSILWDRSLTVGPARSVCEELLPAILRRFQVTRIVVGHTPQLDSKVNTRCGGRLILADAIMSRWMRIADVDEKDASTTNPTIVSLRAVVDTPAELESMRVVYKDSRRIDENMYPRKFYLGKEAMAVQANPQETKRPQRSKRKRGLDGQTNSELAVDDDDERKKNSNIVFGRFLVVFSDGAIVRETPTGIVNYKGVPDASAVVFPRDVSELSGLLETPVSVLHGTIVFINGECHDLLSMEYQHVSSSLSGGVSYLESLISEVESITDKAHANGFRIGFASRATFLANFCLTPTSSANSVKLVNWTGVVKATPEKVQEEKALVKLVIEEHKTTLARKREQVLARAAALLASPPGPPTTTTGISA